MKKLPAILAVVIVGLLVFNYATTGELSLVPSFSESNEDRAVEELQVVFGAAKKQFAQAHRTAAAGGIDTTSDAEAAIGSVKRVKGELELLRKRLTETGAKRDAEELARAVREFVDDLG